MSFSPYLFFDGNCREAMTFYADLFGAEGLEFMTYDAAPPDAAPPGMAADGVMHSQMKLNGSLLMASDVPKDTFRPQQSVSIMHDETDTAKARAKFEALAVGGEVAMPFAPTFWSQGFGLVKDRFGTHWMISGPAIES